MSFTDSSSGGDDGEPNDDVDGDGEPDDDIVVTGEKPRTAGEDEADYEGDPGSDVGSGDDGAVGGGDMAGENDTPCVDQKPTGAELSDINDVARVAATKLGTMQDSTGWEWGALIYRGTDGLLHISEAFTAKHPDELTGATVTLPSGAYVVAYVHTHPIDMTMDQRMLSDPDRRFISDLLGNENINVDDNLLSYVVTKDDAGLHYYDEYKTYVYDKSERISTSAGCTL